MPEDKIFDVSRPQRVAPPATSRPVIVGHHPIMNDPMVTGSAAMSTATATTAESSDSTGTPIHVSMDEGPAENVQTSQSDLSNFSFEPDAQAEQAPAGHEGMSAAEAQHEIGSAEHPQAPENVPYHTEEVAQENPAQQEAHEYTPINSLIGHDGDVANNVAPQQYDAGSTIPPDAGGHWQEVQPLPVPHGAGPKRRWMRAFGWLIGLALLGAIVFFLVVDLGLVQSDVKLPFHIFDKQKTSKTEETTTTTSSPTSPLVQPPATNTIPLGFTQYKIDDTNISFAYPDDWGKPTTTKEEGFSERGTGKKSDGTYAYLVDFAKNKDVQLAFTSSKLLPKKRDALYFDYLQWCVGTNDDKYYQQTLHFTTDKGVDSPSTVTCDQGPLDNVKKLNDSTISQAKAENTKGLVLGDVYSKNLDDKEFTVAHIKDTAMKNADKIDELLETVKTTN